MKKFQDAFSGLRTAFAHKAVRIQFVLAVFAVIGGLIISLDFYEWLAFIICIFLVLFAEVMNTAVERLCDYCKDSYDEKIGMIKDLSSAAVLLSAIGAFAVCLFCVFRRLL